LESLAAVCGSDTLDIVVVENGSANDSYEKLASWIAEWHNRTGLHSVILPEDEFSNVNMVRRPQGQTIALIRSRLNRGFAGANNLGLRYGVQVLNVDYYWILNNDTTVDKQAIAALLRCAAHTFDAGIFGSTVVDYYNNGLVQLAGGARYNRVLTLYRPLLAGIPLLQALNFAGNDSVDFIAGAAMFMRKDVLERVGPLSEDYFLFYEELDYAVRARLFGYGLAWCRQSIVYHKGGMTTGSKSSVRRRKSRIAEYYSTLSALRFTKTFWPGLLPFVFLIRLVLKAVYFVLSNDVRLFGPLCRAYWDFVTGRHVDRYRAESAND
jgi:GT2 family glycosyltransferase